MVWDKKRILEVIKELDKKTGLNGANLPISISDTYVRLGCLRITKKSIYRNKKLKEVYLTPVKFEFTKKLLDGRYSDEDVLFVITHEYVHYYVCRLYPNKDVGHGIEFKNACIKLGIKSGASVKLKVKEDFDTSNIEEKLVYVIKCTVCGNEMIRHRQSNLTKNTDRYRCGKCHGKFTVFKDYRKLI